jgi:hypothetical protein
LGIKKIYHYRTASCSIERERHNMVDPEDRVLMIMEKPSRIQGAHLILTKVRDTLRSEHEESNIKYDEPKGECSVLKDNLNVITEE